VDVESQTPSEQPLDDQKPLDEVTPSLSVNKASLILAGVVLAVNGLLLLNAFSDKSFVAIQIAIITGPIINLIILGISLVGTKTVRSAAQGASIETYRVAAIGLPLAAILADFVIIFSMHLHGS
jgi:hypothetical protein